MLVLNAQGLAVAVTAPLRIPNIFRLWAALSSLSVELAADKSNEDHLSSHSGIGGAPSQGPSVTDETDVDGLVMRAQGGDTEAFGELYRMLSPRIHRYMSFRLGDRQAVEDLTQETFVQAHRALARYEHRSASLFVQWMYGIAKRVSADHHRRRRPTEELPESLSVPGGGLGEIEGMAGDMTVRDALVHLTEEQRQVVVLRFFHGLSHDEIAEMTGRQAGAIRALQFRALQTLRDALA